jgi:MFS family permease
MWLVAVIAALTTASIHAMRPTVAYQALAHGSTPFEVGLVAASYSLLSIVAALPMGRLVDRVGPERFVIVGALLTSITAVVQVFLDSLVAIALVFSITGLGQIITVVAQQTTVANRGGRAGRTERFALYSQAASVGQLVGPAMVGILAGSVVISGAAAAGVPADTSGLTMVFLACALCTGLAAVVGIPLALAGGRGVGTPADDQAAGMMRTAGRVMRRPGMLRAMLVSIVVVSSIDVLVAYLPVYGEVHGLSIAFVSLLLTVRAAATLASRIGLGWWLRRLGRRRVLAAGLTMAAVGMVVLAVGPPEWILIVVMVAFGLGIGIGQPLTMGWVADQSPRSERATAIGIRLMGNRVALLLGPLLMGAIAGAAGIGSTFVTVALLLGAGAGTTFLTPVLDMTPERATDPR